MLPLRMKYRSYSQKSNKLRRGKKTVANRKKLSIKALPNLKTCPNCVKKIENELRIATLGVKNSP